MPLFVLLFVNLCVAQNDYTALHWSCSEANNPQVARILLEFKADIEANSKVSALLFAQIDFPVNYSALFASAGWLHASTFMRI